MIECRWLLFRAVCEADVERVVRYNETHRDKNNIPREPSEIYDAVSNGLFFLAESDGQEIAAVAGVFELRETVPHLEFGATHVDAPWRGFGLQRALMFPLRIAATLVAYSAPVNWTAIKPDNEPSKRSMAENGFVLDAEPIKELTNPGCNNCDQKPKPESGRVCCCDFYKLSTEGWKEPLRRLLALTADSLVVELEHRNTEERLEIEVRSKYVVELREAVEDLAK